MDRWEDCLENVGMDPFTGNQVLTTLNIRGQGRASLAGIENFPQLQVVEMVMNNISDLKPLGALTRLHRVNASFNRIRELHGWSNGDERELQPEWQRPLSICESIETIEPLREAASESLYSNSNKVAQVEAKLTDDKAETKSDGAEKEEITDSLSNRHPALIKAIAQRTKPKIGSVLHELILCSNSISHVDTSIHLLHRLKVLDLSENKITHNTDALFSLPNLQVLNLSGNGVLDLPHQAALQSSKIEVLLMDRNLLTSIVAISSMEQLRVLSVCHNKLSHFGSFRSETLEELRAGNNCISSILEVDALRKCPSLELLDLQQTPLSNTSHYRFRVLVRLPQLCELDEEKVTIQEKVKCRTLHGHGLEERKATVERKLTSVGAKLRRTTFLPPFIDGDVRQLRETCYMCVEKSFAVALQRVSSKESC